MGMSLDVVALLSPYDSPFDSRRPLDLDFEGASRDLLPWELYRLDHNMLVV